MAPKSALKRNIDLDVFYSSFFMYSFFHNNREISYTLFYKESLKQFLRK